MWTAVLAAAGVDVVPSSPSRAQLRWRGHVDDFDVVISTRAVAPSRIHSPRTAAALLVTPTASDAARRRAEELGWSLITDSGQGWLRFHDGVVLRLEAPDTQKGALPGRGRRGWGQWTLVRLLVQQQGLTQNEMAAAVGLSQGRVSRLLAPLREQNLVTLSSCGWGPVDWDALVDWWLSTYPGPGGLTTWWYGLASPREQAIDALRLLADAAGARGSAEPAVSGDVAADAVAPWRRPSSAVLYASVGADLSVVGLTPAADASDGTCRLTIPQDPGVWPRVRHTEPRAGSQLHLVDGMQILWDVARGSGTDVAEQVEHVRGYLRQQWANSQR